MICAGISQRKTLVNCRADFEVPYMPGILTAVSFDSDGNEIARTELETAQNDTVLCVEPEESELTDLVFVPISLRDSNGILKMTADAEITVSIEGPARLLAFGCAKPDGEPDYFCGRSTTWNGRALAVIQSAGVPGTVRITASAPGFEPAAAEIIAK